MKIEHSRRARRDYETVFEHYLNIEPALARRLARELGAVERLLSEQPGMGQPDDVPDTRSFPLRAFPYRLVYRVDRDRLQIARLYHMRRMPASTER